MPKPRRKPARNGRPRTLGPKFGRKIVQTAALVPKNGASSLPPTPSEATAQVSSSTDLVPTNGDKPSWWLPPDSKVRTIALQIINLRIQGWEDERIAKELGISAKSVSPYVYRATKNGWLDIDYNPKERVQLQVMHKVVENLEEGLRSEGVLNTGMKERTHVALKIAEGTIFKQFDTANQPQTTPGVVAIQIVMPSGPPQQIREDTTGGVPAYIDAEVAHAV